MNRRTLTLTQWEWIAERSDRLVLQMMQDAWSLGLFVSRGAQGETLIDCGVQVPGSWEAGRRVVEIAQGGLATARVQAADVGGMVLPEILVESRWPALSAYGLQVSTALSEIDDAIRISGPLLARCVDGRLAMPPGEAQNKPTGGIAVVESDRLPTTDVVDALACRSGLPPSRLVLIVVPAGSIAGSTQIAGRINECVVLTLEESLGIDSARVAHILGAAPIAPPARDGCLPSVTPDDFIHYAGRVVLTIDAASDQDFDRLATQLAFVSTPIYGRRFADLLAEADGVFEAIPGLVDLNKVAHVTIIDESSGATVSAGSRDEAMLAEWLSAAQRDRKETS